MYPLLSKSRAAGKNAAKQHSFCISPIRFTSSVFRHLEEFGVDCLVGLAEHRDEVTGLSHVVRSEEGISCACLLATSCSANAVDIVLRVVGVVKVDDKFHVFNICKIVLTCGIKKKGGQCTGVHQRHHINQINISTAIKSGLLVKLQGCKRLIKQLQTHLLRGETTVGKEKRCTLHWLLIQPITPPAGTTVKPPSEKKLIRSLTISWSMHSLVHSHCSVLPIYCQMTHR